MDWLNDPGLSGGAGDAKSSPSPPPPGRPASDHDPEAPRRRPFVAIAALLVVVVAAALLPRLWSAPAESAGPSASPTAVATDPPLAPVTAPAVTTDPEAPQGSAPAEPEYLPPETQQRLLDTAEAAMKAFARPGKKVTSKQWFNRLRRHLTGEAAEAYEATDPRAVPFTRLTRPVVMGPIVDEADLTRAVDAATNGGRWRVWISMLDFRVEAFQPLGD